MCEHRWNPIGNMVAFRNKVAGTDLNNWYNQGDVVAFGRGNKGFFAMAKQGHAQMQLQSGMPSGSYCDLITDCKKKINVDGSGKVSVNIDNNEEPIIAIVVGGTSSGGDHSQGTSRPDNTFTPNPNTPRPTIPVDTSGYQRTVILLQKATSPGQDVFIRGGIDHTHLRGCTQDATTSPCAIPIKHRNMGTSSFFGKFNAWSKGDSHLDFYGAEVGQGSYNGQKPDGSPSVWSTSHHGAAGYNPLNTYGEHYWILDIDMDCGKSEQGFFEMKGIVSGNWEANIYNNQCTGSGATTPPFTSNDHIGRCGYMNVYKWSSGDCEIKPIP